MSPGNGRDRVQPTERVSPGRSEVFGVGGLRLVLRAAYGFTTLGLSANLVVLIEMGVRDLQHRKMSFLQWRRFRVLVGVQDS